MLVLSRADLRRLVTMREAVELMKVAFVELAEGRANSPLRGALHVDDQSAFLSMPASVPSAGALGIKIVSFFGGNAARSLPTIHALVYMVDAVTGEPLAIMEGGYVTALRTGAVSGAATDLLARGDAATLAVIGCGVQGVTQAAAVCAVRPITRIIGVDPRPEAREAFVAAFRSDWPDYRAVVETSGNADEAVGQADVVCTATTARAPVFEDASIRPGTHINAVGAFTPEMQEIPPATVARSRIVVDDLKSCLAEAGDLIQPLRDGLIDRSRLSIDLGTLAGGHATGRTGEQDVTFFKSVGNAVQDVIVGQRVVQRAKETCVGVNIDLF